MMNFEVFNDPLDTDSAEREQVIEASLDADREALQDLRSDVEQQGSAWAEQYYMLWKTTVKHGDINKVKNAISTQENIRSAHISILGGADQLFMSTEGWQRVLDVEIAKLKSLKNSFSGDNKLMVDRLIAELSDNTKHANLAQRFIRGDGRSNLGNAKLIAARIASWYHEVLTTMIQQGVDVVFSYTVNWDRCVIGSQGDNLSDRKIHVNVSLDFLVWEDVDLDLKSSDNEDDWAMFTPITEPVAVDIDPELSQVVWTDENTPATFMPIDEAIDSLDAQQEVIEEVVEDVQEQVREGTESNNISEDKEERQYEDDVVVLEKELDVDQVFDSKEEPVAVDIDPKLSDDDSIVQEKPIDIFSPDAIKTQIQNTLKRPLIFWKGDADSQYQFDSEDRELLDWWYEVIRVRNHQGNVVLDIGINPDGFPYIWLWSYEHIVTQDVSRDLVEKYVNYLNSSVLGTTSIDFAALLDKVKKGYDEYNLVVSSSSSDVAGLSSSDDEVESAVSSVYEGQHSLEQQHKGENSVNDILSHNPSQHALDDLVKNLEYGRIYTISVAHERLTIAKNKAKSDLSLLVSHFTGKKSVYPEKDYSIVAIHQYFIDGKYVVDIDYIIHDTSNPWKLDQWSSESVASLEIDPIIAHIYEGLGDEWLQLLHANLLHLPDTKLQDALRDEHTFDIVDELLRISRMDIADKWNVQKELVGLILSKELSDRVAGFTMRQLVDWLLQVEDIHLKRQLIGSLIVWDSYGAMRVLGMKKWSEYANNTITDVYKLNHIFLKNITERRNRVFHGWFDILSGNTLLSNEFGQKWVMPADVKNAYMMFVSDGIRWQIKDTLPSQNIPSRKIQSQGNYAIISKTDGHMYLFDADHRLVSRKSVLLGRDRSDASFRVHDYPIKNDAWQTVNFAPPKRTPRGLYSIEARWPKDKIGRYMQFFPKDNQIDYGPLNKNGDRKWTIGIHELYSNEYTKRDAAIRSSNVHDKFLSNGCINMHNNYYAEVWDHLHIGSSVYVS